MPNPFTFAAVQSPEGSLSAGEAAVLFGITACVILLFFVALKRMRRLKQEEGPGKVESEPSRDEPAAPKSKRGRGKKVQHKASARSQLRQWEKPPKKETPEPEVPIVVEEAVVPATFVDGLQKTRREGFMAKIRRVLNKDLAPDILDEMEEVLLTADIGVKTATSMLNNVREKMSRSELTSAEGVVEALREEASKILEPASQWETKESAHPTVVLMVGVNGSGKTTSTGKLAHRAVSEGKRVLLIAADTFRAAAVEQLEVWSQRAGVDFHKGKDGADPASVVFDGVKKGVEEGYDLVLCDTAGRLHTDKNLIEELKKVVRVAGKAFEGCPHEVILVLDSTNGQNAVHQAKSFTADLGVTGLILTKLDGTARGGVVLGIVDELSLPIRDIGVGEGIEDLRQFDRTEFLDALFMRDEEAA
jgi:fused signal recognition particle receptor